MEKLSIPPISNEELMRRYLKIRPIAEIAGTKYWLREYTLVELRTLAYLWSLFPDKTEPVGEALSNHSHYDFECLHSMSCYGIFRPKISEVLAQIPQDVLKKYDVDAFEIIKTPTTTGGFNAYKKALDIGFHFSLVRLYVRKKS